jgi:hypothetical protein
MFGSHFYSNNFHDLTQNLNVDRMQAEKSTLFNKRCLTKHYGAVVVMKYSVLDYVDMSFRILICIRYSEVFASATVLYHIFLFKQSFV